MPINTSELLDAVAILADKTAMKTTVVQDQKSPKEAGAGSLIGVLKSGCSRALICGAGSLVGGLLMGPPGLAIGGVAASGIAAGGITAYKMKSGSIDSIRLVGDIIRNDLTVAQQEMLCAKIVNSVIDIDLTDAALLLPLVLNNYSIKRAVLNTLASFITNELNLQIVN